MQSNVAEILAAADAVDDITEATARELRETDDYPFFYCGGRELPAASNQATDSQAKIYDQDWQYVNQLYVEANTGKDSGTDYSDYDQAETLAEAFLDNLLESAEWELNSLDYYPAKMGGTNVIIAHIVVSKFRTKKYGN